MLGKSMYLEKIKEQYAIKNLPFPNFISPQDFLSVCYIPRFVWETQKDPQETDILEADSEYIYCCFDFPRKEPCYF